MLAPQAIGFEKETGTLDGVPFIPDDGERAA
jgi:hypothetical protein